MITPNQMDEIFGALERQIREEGGAPVSLVVIGGTALAVLGRFVRTATKDVDVLGEAVEREGTLEIRKLASTHAGGTAPRCPMGAFAGCVARVSSAA